MEGDGQVDGKKDEKIDKQTKNKKEKESKADQTTCVRPAQIS